jgi:hypothetical protein
MSDLREPKAGDYQVRKVKVYLTKEAIKKDGREEPDILESLYKGSDFYFCGEHFEISKYFDNDQSASWEEELIASDIEELAEQLYSIGIRETDSLHNINRTYDVPGDDDFFVYTHINESQWLELQEELNKVYETKVEPKPEQLEFIV